MNKLIVGIIAIVVIAGGAALVFTRNDSPQAVTTKEGKYCSSEGVLTDTMPIQSHRSYCIKSNATKLTYVSGTPVTYSFSIVDDQGNTLKDFAITHTKPMHVIAVRKDLANFQHVHPEFDETTGVFTLSDLTFPTDGEYRIFADFAPEGAMLDAEGMPLPVTLSQDVRAGNAYNPEPLGSEERTKTFDGTQVALTTMPQNLMAGMESMLTFSLSRASRPVTDLEEYLGALGHSVVLREGTLDFIHAHPMDNNIRNQNGKVEFMVTLPQAGRYKVFTQFQRGGKVFTSNFVISAAQSPGMPDMTDMDMSMPGMEH